MPRPRIAALEPPYEPETASLLAKWMPPGSDVEPLHLFRTLAVAPGPGVAHAAPGSGNPRPPAARPS